MDRAVTLTNGTDDGQVNGNGDTNGYGHAHHSMPRVFDGLIGKAPAFDDVLSRLPALARGAETVLITGETGTGKELVARAIHQLGPRSRAPFIPVNCGAMVDTLLESELFGHERGAFTDAHARRPGLITLAAGGTLFLDEAETLTRRAQIALLRVLQDRTFRPVGGATEHRVDVRFVAATNARLDHMVQGGRFRADLYYRLCVFSVSLPPLRARRGDILELADHFLGKHTVARRRPRLSSGAAEALLAFDWPGNIRELENTMLRAINRVTEGTIEVHDLELPCVNDIDDVAAVSNGSPGAYKTQKRQVIEAFERQYLTRLMTAHRGNVTRAARTAGKERRDLGKLLKRHGLDPRLFVTSPQDIADD